MAESARSAFDNTIFGIRRQQAPSCSAWPLDSPRNLVAAAQPSLGYTSVRLARFWHLKFSRGNRGETNGGLSLVWISNVWINLDARASVLGRAQQRHLFQPASPHRPPSGQATAHLPGGQPGPRA